MTFTGEPIVCHGVTYTMFVADAPNELTALTW